MIGNENYKGNLQANYTLANRICDTKMDLTQKPTMTLLRMKLAAPEVKNVKY